jgi:hypothetical protein
MNIYRKYSDEDLIEAYSTMMDYSGKPTKEMLTAIETRGGLEKFLNELEFKRIHQSEIGRIRKHVHELCKKGLTLDSIKSSITSETLSENEVDSIIQKRFDEYQFHVSDTKITAKTIYGSLFGFILGTLLGSLFLTLVYSFFATLIFFPIILTYIICYFTIKFFTKQSRSNAVVFVASFLATIASALLASGITYVLTTK